MQSPQQGRPPGCRLTLCSLRLTPCASLCRSSGLCYDRNIACLRKSSHLYGGVLKQASKARIKCKGLYTGSKQVNCGTKRKDEAHQSPPPPPPPSSSSSAYYTHTHPTPHPFTPLPHPHPHTYCISVCVCDRQKKKKKKKKGEEEEGGGAGRIYIYQA